MRTANHTNTEEKLIELGEQARKLGAHHAFEASLDQIITIQHDIIANSAVDEQAKREGAYHLIRAVESIRVQFNVIQERGERAQRKREKNERSAS